MLKRREEEGQVATGRRKERREELLGMMLEETSLLRAREEAIDGLMLNLGSLQTCSYCTENIRKRDWRFCRGELR